MRRLSERNVSNQSIITIIEKFVKSVNMMEDTILIPSKLMDKQVCKKSLKFLVNNKYKLYILTSQAFYESVIVPVSISIIISLFSSNSTGRRF